MEALVSIIVPVYNCEKYIKRCIDSILRQSYTNFELVLVDDGSTDESGKICDLYAETDQRIIVIHKENGGVSEAREYGIQRSNGEYIAFIDADDYITEDYLKVLYQDIIKHQADIACCDCVELVNGVQSNRFHNVLKSRIIADKNMYVQDYLGKKEFYAYVVWGKLIKKDIMSGQAFKRIAFGEDTVYMMNLLETAQITVLNDYKGYFYIRNEGSATMKGAKDVLVLLNHIYIGEALVHLSKLCGKEMQVKAANTYAAKIYRALSTLIQYNDRTSYEENYHYICLHINSVLKLEGLKKKYRYAFWLYKAAPKVFWIAAHGDLRKKRCKE